MTGFPATEMSPRDLERYKPTRHEPPDFAAFWRDTLTEARRHARPPTATPHPNGLRTISTRDVTFSGWGGQPVKAWLHRPADNDAPLPCVIEYSGYGQGRGLPHERTLYAQAGYAHLLIDARGQAGGPRRSDTPDITTHPIDTPSVLTRGLYSPTTAYLTRLVVDSALAIEAACQLPGVDQQRIMTTGISQGGGLALIATALTQNTVKALACDVPFLAGLWRGVALATQGPYTEIRDHLARFPDRAADIWTTLGYLDALNFAPRATATAQFSVGLLDDVCPASAVYATYNHYPAAKQLHVWKHNGHEGGGPHQDQHRLAFLAAAAEVGPSRQLVESGTSKRPTT